MKRPTGVTVIAVFLIVGATVLPAFVVLFPLKNANTFSKSLLMLMSLIELVLSMGLWKMKNWARVCTAILVSIGLLSVIASLLRGSHWLRFAPWLIAENVLLAGIDLWMLIYLLSPSVRQAFSKRRVL